MDIVQVSGFRLQIAAATSAARVTGFRLQLVDGTSTARLTGFRLQFAISKPAADQITGTHVGFFGAGGIGGGTK